MNRAARVMLALGLLALTVGCARTAKPTDATFDPVYTEFNRLLVAHVDDSGVDWKGLVREKEAVGRVCERLASVSAERFEGFSPNEQLAFLINLFNASAMCKIVGIIGHPEGGMPVAGDLKRIYSRWDVACMGKLVSLQWIEQRIMQDYHEPRAIFLLSPGRADRPFPPPFAAEAETLDKLAERQTIMFFRRSVAYRYDYAAEKLFLNRLLRQYRRQFESNYTKLVYFVRGVIRETERLQIDKVEPRIRWLEAEGRFMGTIEG